MEASSASSMAPEVADAPAAPLPWSKPTSLRGAAGYKKWTGGPGLLPGSTEEDRGAAPAESSTAWANRVRAQKKDAALRASLEEASLREGGSRSRSRNSSRGQGEGKGSAAQRRVAPWRPRSPTGAMAAWERLYQPTRSSSRPPSRQLYRTSKVQRDAEADQEPVASAGPPASRKASDSRGAPWESVSEMSPEPESYDATMSSQARPAWNRGVAGGPTRGAWTTGPQALRASLVRASRPSSRLSSRQASREGSVVADLSYQAEGQLSRESSRTDLVSISSHEEDRESEKPANRGPKKDGGSRPSSRQSLVSRNDENRVPGSRPSTEESSFQRSALSDTPADAQCLDLQSKKARISLSRSTGQDVRHSWGGATRAPAASRTSSSLQRPASARDWSPIRKRKDDPVQPQTLAEYMATPRSPLRSPVCPPRPLSARGPAATVPPLTLDTPPNREAARRSALLGEEDADEGCSTPDVQQRISAARHNTTDLRPATTANVTRAGLLSAPAFSSVQEVDLSTLADKLFQPRTHMPRSTTSPGAATFDSAPPPGESPQPPAKVPSRRQSAIRRDAAGAPFPGPGGAEDAPGSQQADSSDEARLPVNVLRRPPSRQRPPPESLHLFTGEPAGPAPDSGSLELEARPETSAGHMRVGLPNAWAVQSQPINRLHKLFIRPPSRQRPPPEALCLGDFEAELAEKSFREIYSSSDCESP